MIKKLALSITLTLLVLFLWVLVLFFTLYFGGSYLSDLSIDNTLFLDDAREVLPMAISLSSTIFIAVIFLALLKKYKIQNEVWSKAFLFSAFELHIFTYVLILLSLVAGLPIFVTVSVAIIVYSFLMASIQTSPVIEGVKETSRYKVFLLFFIPIILLLIFFIRDGVIIKKAGESSIFFQKYEYGGNGYTYPTPSQYPELAQIRDFIIDSKFPVLHIRSLLGGFPNGKVRVVLEDINPEYDLIIFSVEYGIESVTLFEWCFHDEAIGMKHNDKVGIVELISCRSKNVGFDTDNLQRYDFDSGDADLFSGAIRDEIINKVYMFYPRLLYLAAKDKDTSEETLLIISKELSPLNNESYYGRIVDDFHKLTAYENDELFYDEFSPYDIALALLENPRVRGNKEILIQINSIPMLKLDPDEYAYDEDKKQLERLNKTYTEVKSGVQDLLNKLK